MNHDVIMWVERGYNLYIWRAKMKDLGSLFFFLNKVTYKRCGPHHYGFHIVLLAPNEIWGDILHLILNNFWISKVRSYSSIGVNSYGWVRPNSDQWGHSISSLTFQLSVTVLSCQGQVKRIVILYMFWRSVFPLFPLTKKKLWLGFINWVVNKANIQRQDYYLFTTAVLAWASSNIFPFHLFYNI